MLAFSPLFESVVVVLGGLLASNGRLAPNFSCKKVSSALADALGWLLFQPRCLTASELTELIHITRLSSETAACSTYLYRLPRDNVLTQPAATYATTLCGALRFHLSLSAAALYSSRPLSSPTAKGMATSRERR